MRLARARERPVVLLSSALRYVVRDVGNGVDRLEAYELIPIDQALVETSLPDRTEIYFEPNDRLDDFGKLAFSSLGFECDGDSAGLLKVFARPIDERTLEITLWLKGL